MQHALPLLTCMVVAGMLLVSEPVEAKKLRWPKKLRVQLHSPGELLPPCWGRPQACSDKGEVTPNKSVPDFGPPPKPYYIVAQFQCASKRTRMPTGGDCVRTVFSDQSCSVALNEIERIARGPDVCRKCTDVVDEDLYWTGKKDHVQGGPCSGM